MSSSCSLLRRLLIILYDSMLLVSIYFLLTMALLPITKGQAIASGNIFYAIYLLLIAYVYFGWQWTHGGQTLGMRTWKVKLISDSRNSIDWKKATIRFGLSILSWLLLGGGFLWALFNKDYKTLHDQFSATRLIRTDRQDNLPMLNDASYKK
jgi:uncharacterized RDD family membrane protein YckC